MTGIYNHPDVGHITFDSASIVVTDGEIIIRLPIGPLGLAEILANLASVAATELAKK